jgi:hypothetical protein
LLVVEVGMVVVEEVVVVGQEQACKCLGVEMMEGWWWW